LRKKIAIFKKKIKNTPINLQTQIWIQIPFLVIRNPHRIAHSIEKIKIKKRMIIIKIRFQFNQIMDISFRLLIKLIIYNLIYRIIKKWTIFLIHLVNLYNCINSKLNRKIMKNILLIYYWCWINYLENLVMIMFQPHKQPKPQLSKHKEIRTKYYNINKNKCKVWLTLAKYLLKVLFLNQKINYKKNKMIN